MARGKGPEQSRTQIKEIEQAERESELKKLVIAVRSLKSLVSVLNGNNRNVTILGDEVRRIEKSKFRLMANLGSERSVDADFVINILTINGIMQNLGSASKHEKGAHQYSQPALKIEYLFFPAKARVVIPQLLLKLEQILQKHAAAPRKLK